MEICKKYFKINNEIINGFKIVENGNYDIYVYTSCKKLNNWQLFLTFETIEKVKRYFNMQLNNHLSENDSSIEWNKIGIEWIKSIVYELNENY
ncbi:hypothetical protein [Terrisporobacter sp.]|uniref:hypothetical protein n=1 Tax=Terrisporobacter sp. TaxID=1965305 RepID=UPI00289F4BD7|nr:hypothetical protein [Terrisporobacter sp.]